MQTLTLAKGIYTQYRKNVQESENDSLEQVRRKMTRNMQLAHRTVRENGSIYYKYGCLHFIVAKGMVVWLQNNSKPEKGWKRDDKKYLELTKELGIESDATLLSLKVKRVKCDMKYRINKLKWKVKLCVVQEG